MADMAAQSVPLYGLRHGSRYNGAKAGDFCRRRAYSDAIESEVAWNFRSGSLRCCCWLRRWSPFSPPACRVPYVVGLVAAGIALSFFHLQPELELTKELVFTALLPPLVFEAALYLRWRQLRRELPVVLLLATAGVAISALVTAFGMYYFVQWAWPSALIFGVLIAATDPVSVIATFKEQHVHGRLRLLVEAESLLNDGTAAVGFALALSFAQGMNVTGASIPVALLTTSLGGILCGAAVAGLVLGIAGRTTNNLIELTLTTVVAYGSFLLADHFGLSGVLATVTAGLLVGNIGPLGSISEHGRASVQGFWEYAAFIANSIIFLLIGIHEAEQPFALILPAIAAAILFVLLGRALSVYPLCALFARSTSGSPCRTSTYSSGADCVVRLRWRWHWDSPPTCHKPMRSCG